MIFVDSNILIDVWQNDPRWSDWSLDRLSMAADDQPAIVNAIIVAEVSRNFGSLNEVHERFAALDILSLPIGDGIAFTAGQRFAAYRRRKKGDGPSRLLPDFLIGAHAVSLGAQLLTRDAAIYRTYFPDLSLITPETHPHG